MKTLLAAISLFFGPILLFSQPTAPPILSTVPLSPEQVAVYRAFLVNYLSDGPTRINLSELTTRFQPDDGDFKGCMKDFALTPGITVVHRFSNEFSDLHKVVLVNADEHKLADPGAGIRQGQSVDDAVRAGFSAGVLRISEILFDSKHQFAAFNYSFACGSLCGHGGTVVFELKSGQWKQSGRNCGYWIS